MSKMKELNQAELELSEMMEEKLQLEHQARYFSALPLETPHTVADRREIIMRSNLVDNELIDLLTKMCEQRILIGKVYGDVMGESDE